MPADFDPMKAIREEMTGLNEVQVSLYRLERNAEERMSQAESELNAVRKVRGYVIIELERKREILQQLEKEESK